MINLQSTCIIKICEIFQIVEQAFFFALKAVDQTFKNGFEVLSFSVKLFFPNAPFLYSLETSENLMVF